MAYTCRDEQMTFWTQVSPFTFPWISGIKLPMPRFCDKHLYLMKPFAPSAPTEEWTVFFLEETSCRLAETVHQSQDSVLGFSSGARPKRFFLLDVWNMNLRGRQCECPARENPL